MTEDTSNYEVMSMQKMTQKGKMSPYAQRMKYAREITAVERGLTKLSQAKFARMLGVHPSNISHVEAGTTRIQPELARAIEKETGIRQAWLLTGQGPVRSADRAPCEWREEQLGFSYVRKVKPLLSGGTGQFVDDEKSEDIYSFRTDWLSRKGPVSAMRLAQISGDSMAPTLADGDLVLFDTSQNSPLDGKIMVVGIDNLLYIKRVRVSPDGTFLVSDNRAVYEPWRVDPENTRFLGLVIWHCGEL